MLTLDLPFVIHTAATQHSDATDARQTKHEKVKSRRRLGEFLMPLLKAECVTAGALSNPDPETVSRLRGNLQLIQASEVSDAWILLERRLDV
jgi:hypothetical protein